MSEVLSLYEILKANKTGIAPDMWTALAGMNWGGADSGTEVKELAGIPPLSFTADGTPLLDYLISGNMEQTGTPTPTTPIQPQECGERTGNLWDGNYENGILNTDGTLNSPNYNYNTTMYILTEEKSYTLSVVCNYNEGLRFLRVCFYDENKNFISYVDSPAFSGESLFYKFNFTAPANSKYLRFSYIFRVGVSDTNIMLNLGSTALPYENFGYKIPISSGGENLWDEDYTGINTNAIYRPLFVGDGVFTLSTNFKQNNIITDIFILSGNVSSGINSSINGAYEGKNITAQSVDGYITIAYRANARTGSGSLPYCKTMLNRGSTAIPYEPYDRTTTPVYLGEVESTRQIKKLVLTGEETSWQSALASEGRNRFTLPILNAMQADTAHFTSLSTHLPLGVEGATWNTDDIYTIVSSKLYMRLTAQYNTLADFKAYLAQQYANGTPVTVWYVLATPTTGIVNEPLRKIGDYADTVSYEQAGVQIPTNRGNTVIDVETTLKPSEMYIKYQE